MMISLQTLKKRSSESRWISSNEIEQAANGNTKEENSTFLQNNDLYEDLKQVINISSESSSDYENEPQLSEIDMKKLNLLVPKIKHCYCIFGDLLQDILFEKDFIDFNTFTSKIKDLFLISDSESNFLCRYLYEVNYTSTPVNCSKNSSKINQKLESLIGEYTSFQNDIIDMITLEFMYCFKSSQDPHKKTFIKNLRTLCECENISPIDIHNLVCFSEVQLNSHYLCAYLCRESKSMAKITPLAIETLISKLTSRHKKFENLKAIPKRLNSLKNTLKMSSQELIKQPTDSMPEVNAEKLQALFLRFADFLFENNISLNDI